MTGDSILFFEKPGCLTNKRQKDQLRRSGYTLEVKNLLRYDWQADELLPYLQQLPVVDWFNMSAPAIKGGAINPASLTPAAALQALLDDHLLIRRPLLKKAGLSAAGFTPHTLARLGITLLNDDIEEGCSSKKPHHPCPEPLEA